MRITGQRISLIYAPRPGLPALEGVDAGLILTESRGGIPASTCRSCCSAARTSSASRSAAGSGAFISGGEHAYLYETPDGEVREDRPLLAGPT